MVWFTLQAAVSMVACTGVCSHMFGRQGTELDGGQIPRLYYSEIHQ